MNYGRIIQLFPISRAADRRRRHLFQQIRSIVVFLPVVLFWTFAAQAVDALDARLADDIAFTKSTIVLLTAGDTAAVRDRLDPAMGAASDDTLRRMSEVFGAQEPASIEIVWQNERHEYRTGDGVSRIVLEYKLASKWVVVDAAVRTKGDSKRLLRFFITPNEMPLEQLNAFHLLGKGPGQYLFLAGWLAVIVLTGWAIVIAFRRHKGWRRWAFIALMPLGMTPTLAMNWNTAQMWIVESGTDQTVLFVPLLALRYPMALFSSTEMRVPFLYVSAPLFAFGYLIWHWISLRKKLLLAPCGDRGNQLNS